MPTEAEWERAYRGDPATTTAYYNGANDPALCTSCSPTTKDAKLETVQLIKDPLMVICHPHHPFAKMKAVKFKALAGQKFIGFEPDIPTRKALDRILKDHDVQVQTVMEFDNIETVKRAVEIDAGISIVPQNTVTQEVSKQTLAAVPIDDAELFRPLAAIYKKSKVLSPAMRQFIDILREGSGKGGK